ncbi:MAG TPA: M20/M25/M40 family metallo-hydrolase [Roseiflexaceae bacterium]|nr:M20/M25/M40 family metallo-hydrolase [Roseiflexaceae bacterium]HMP40527.1 M20/M25/M40 family metallo-hydrolase [Roseiflexaceae bacterium]
MTETLRAELVDLTTRLMAFESIEARPDQLTAVIDYAEAYIRTSPGVFVHRVERNRRPSLMVTLRDTHTPAVIYNAHLDVVPARPDQYIAQVRDGRIYGRGSQDMKGAAAVYLRLLRDLAALDTPPDVGFQFVSDEEIGGLDGTGLLLEQGWRCGLFVAGEPTDLQICYAQKGIMRVDIVVPGRPAHGSRPWEGRNAIATLRDGLIALEQRFPTPDEPAWMTTVVPTIVSGGTAENRLPEEVRLRLDIRFIAEDSPTMIIAALHDCFPQAAIIGDPIEGGLLNTDIHNPAVQQLATTVADVTGTPAGFYREHYGSDARFYSDAGIPSVCCGPTGAGLHSDEEWVDIASLVQFYAISRRLVGA